MNEQDKRFIYFPSLSAGSMVSAFKKDMKFDNGDPVKFFDSRYPDKWRHPYFLITAGHHYKKMDFRNEIGLEKDVLVFGDSGGYQIATGALPYSNELREKIFHWLEANSDVAANLDIPPKTMYRNKFAECADISYDNFAYFEKHQSGKTKYLNMLQGSNTDEYTWWYHKFKHFDFQGWAIGGPQKLVDFMFAVALMLKEKTFENPRLEYLHLLGISKISDFFILATLQKLMNKNYGNRIYVTTDSSSPGQYPVYGTYLHSANYKTQTFSELYFPKNAEYRRQAHIRQGNLQSNHLLGLRHNHRANHPISRPINHPINRAVNHPDNHRISLHACRLVSLGLVRQVSLNRDLQSFPLDNHRNSRHACRAHNLPDSL